MATSYLGLPEPLMAKDGEVQKNKIPSLPSKTNFNFFLDDSLKYFLPHYSFIVKQYEKT